MDTNTWWDILWAPYRGGNPVWIGLELLAVLLGMASVWYAKKQHIAVFPTGIVSTGIYVWLLAQYSLLGDMMINAYYVVMSVYGWWYWRLRGPKTDQRPISYMSGLERWWALALAVGSSFWVVLVYQYYDRWTSWTAYADTLTTALFFVAMWLMARKKMEHWTFWMVGNLISIPLYWYKGLIFTSFQYAVFTAIALAGYRVWKSNIDRTPQTSLK